MTPISRTILVIDDSPEDRELYRRYLLSDREYSYNIIEAGLGQQGLELYQQHQPDAVLLDYRLPDLNGLEFLTKLQFFSQQSCLPIILVTGQGNEKIAVQSIKAGAQDYLVKEHITPESLRMGINGAIATVQLHKQLKQRINREKVIAQITQKIYQSLDIEEILQTTVTEVRQFLQTDRVIVFQLQSEGWGEVVTESVSENWTAILASSLLDPCLSQVYLERFQQGLVTVKSDIHDSSIEPCHVELLERFQVKASLTVPILQNGALWGLLIAHHCSARRQWQTLEIDLLKELASQVGIALQQAKLYKQAQDELTERRRVEAELKDSEERFRQLAENIDVVFWVTESKGEKVSYISPAYERLWGLSRQELYDDRQTWINYIHSEDREETLNNYLENAADGKFDVEYRIILPNGRERWIHDRCFPLRDNLGEVYRFVGIAEDISDRKQTELEIKEGRGQLQQRLSEIEAIYQNAPIGLAVLDTDLRFMRINQRLAEINGLPVEAHIGKTVRELLPDLVESAEPLLRSVLETGEPLLNLEICGETPAQPGVKRNWLGHYLPLKDNNGKVIGLSTVCEEITERINSQEALRQSEERYRCLAELIPQLVWTANAEGVLMDVNQRWLDFTGITLEQIQKDGWETIVHFEDLEFIYSKWMESGQEGAVYEAEGRIRRWDGQYFWYLHQAIPQTNERGEIIRWFGTGTNIEAQKQLEIDRNRLLEQEQFARKQAERANQLKDDFLAMLSHELRSPLNPILGWANLLQTRKFSEAETTKALETIERNAKLQNHLIGDLLDMSKILRGRLSVESAPVSLAFAIESAIDTVRPAAIAKSILINSFISPVGEIYGDASRLQQVIWNLLSNAIKFSPHNGRVEIRLERVGNYAQLTVSDTGKGIDPEFLPYIFEPFRQENTSTTRNYGGLGLGLAIVSQLVDAHGGTITANSSGNGLGSTFTVRFPLLNTKLESDRVNAEISETEPNLNGICILVVDDEFDTRYLLQVILTQLKAKVLAVASVSEALASLESFQPNILISDIGMPDADGYALINRIRNLPADKGGEIPAIALTAYCSSEDCQKAIDCGYQLHVSKPIDPEQLLKALLALAIKKYNFSK